MAAKKRTERKILLILDNPKERNNLGSRLRMQNFDVESASDGFHAIHLIEKTKYDILIIVEDMSDMPGHEILCLARNVKSKEELPILFMSKSASQESIIEYIESGANEYLVYSHNFNAILQAIDKHCPPPK